MVLGITTAALASGHAAKSGAGAAASGLIAGAEAVAGVLGATLWAVVMIAVVVIDVGMAIIPAYLAYKCNPKSPFVMTLVGFFFSEIYMFQFLLRKFVIKEKGYCAGLC